MYHITDTKPSPDTRRTNMRAREEKGRKGENALETSRRGALLDW
jgi:hypothetical protein